MLFCNIKYILNILKFFILIIFFFIKSPFYFPKAIAIVQSRPIGSEKRIKIINYSPNSVIKFVGHYMYHSIIEFAPDEEIKTITMGISGGWQMHPAGNRIFLKPINEDKSTTNMTVITDKRMYFFEMHAEYATSIRDANLSFITKFLYPQAMTFGENNNASGAAVVSLSDNNVAPDISKPDAYNFGYKISGPSTRIEPIMIFDDGEFTYFKFRNINAELPAIFLVNEQNDEELVNYRVASGYVIIERVHDRYTLRLGKNTICIFNENFDKKTFRNKNKSQ
ncbi:TrbG/VirB9 family P-type conjugative transfer protein [Lyticum sinuosum]|uniref:Type IV secretion system protein VirB9 n=1 Tax=Lyticum sinuosum TaxID=1332059 RepID=A0AAE4VL00_9RICK|nr:TrbG/VirB9 family P-type conjugative transfer protein [Lyticum sinuosum]MDZ5761555.1 Type IV secretion system protein VirB9 [Lyticum sinuosum]